MKKLLLSLAAVALIAAPASASVQNVKVSGSVDSTYVDRQGLDINNVGTNKQGVFLTQTSLRVDADLTDNVSATVSLLNERTWENAPGATQQQLDVNLAFVTLREFLYSPLTLVVGRQDFKFGNGFIMDSAAGEGNSNISGVANDLSKRFALDAIRATLDYNPLTLDLVYFRATQGTTGVFAGSPANIDVWGANANYALGDDMGTVFETYIWKRWDRTDSDTAGDEEDELYVYGLRASASPLEGVSSSIEYAHQSGSSETTAGGLGRNKNANAFQFVTNYQLPVLEEYKPVLTYVFSKYSGDVSAAGAGDQRDSGWDEFYNDQLEGIGYTLFSKTNLLVHDVYLETTPMEDVTAGLRWQGFWLDKDFNNGDQAFTSANRGGAAAAVFAAGDAGLNASESYLGSEFDFDLTYDYTEDVQVGATLGYFASGDFFRADLNAKQALVNLIVAF
jgi:hypothetical protein